jgi:hypothetical protein
LSPPIASTIIFIHTNRSAARGDFYLFSQPVDYFQSPLRQLGVFIPFPLYPVFQRTDYPEIYVLRMKIGDRFVAHIGGQPDRRLFRKIERRQSLNSLAVEGRSRPDAADST